MTRRRREPIRAWSTAAMVQSGRGSRLASCVINEYNGFCPLPANYTPNCINGAQTQGENIADNGGELLFHCNKSESDFYWFVG